jgi:hypothetical protein
MPTLSGTALKRRLERREFSDLFVEELGWDRLRGVADQKFEVDGQAVRLEGVVQKRDVPVYLHRSPALPDRDQRRRIERALSGRQLEHLIVFLGEGDGAQVWQWVKREPSRPERVREHAWRPGEPVEALRQKLDALQFTLQEEEAGRIEVTEVTNRLKRAFDADRVTRGFYTEFKAQHDALLAFLKALPEDVRSWYASVTLNRLMFVYFIQKKGFIDGRADYLNEQLRYSKAKLGKDKFFTGVLGPLFFRGFALPQSERTDADKALLGKVPYLNGGLFQQHQIERDHGDKIVLPDKAFETLFAFFDNWRWHLDERDAGPDAAGLTAAQARAGQGREINPDVLGYIFEKYVNQKQMGAYYTKEDITDYICSNTILPRLLDKVRAQVPVAFKGEASIWRLLRDVPDRYIWPSLRHGVDQHLPQAIEAGVADASQRTGWDRPATRDLGLPTETWRETVHRRDRCVALRVKLLAGEIASPDAMVIANLDIARFVQDAIQQASEDQLKAWWSALNSLTVLDPACGSGAFLFAALNILEPLYTKVFEAMQTTVADARRAADHVGRAFEKGRWKPFTDVLDEAARHANPAYFVLRSIALNNLYGVDIMEEAAEICKLRLFLKLVAQLDDADKIEPLPDLDFNIRSGNSLVGIVADSDFDRVKQKPLDFGAIRLRIREEAEIADQAFQRFRSVQIVGEPSANELRTLKGELASRLASVADQSNRWVSQQYGIDPADQESFSNWNAVYEPFNWFTEFMGVMSDGGFDVVIGNPPFLEATKVPYSLGSFETAESRAVHGAFVERFSSLRSRDGALGIVLPMSIVSTQRMKIVQDQLQNDAICVYTNFSWRPATLFDGVNRAITIAISLRASANRRFSTGYVRWNSDSRENLTSRLNVLEVPESWNSWSVPKLSSPLEADIIDSMRLNGQEFGLSLSGRANPIYYKSTGGLYWKVFTSFPPKFIANGKVGTSSRQQSLFMGEARYTFPAAAILNSSLFWWWYTLTSNLRDLNPSDIRGFRIPKNALESPKLRKLGEELMADLKANSVMMTRQQRTTGKTQVQSFRVKASKALIDKIDDELIGMLNLNDTHSDYIRSYDAGWRLSVFGGDEDDGEAA